MLNFIRSWFNDIGLLAVLALGLVLYLSWRALRRKGRRHRQRRPRRLRGDDRLRRYLGK